MSSTQPPVPPPSPGQTIVLERRERSGCLRRLFWPVLLISGLLNLGFFSEELSSMAPDRLEESYVAGSLTPTNKIAIVRIEGVIALDAVDYAVKQIRQARIDDAVKAVVLRVNSPGGTVTGSDAIWREIALLKESGKPVVVSMGGLAASGGYYVSAPADHIIAEPTTTTGSIGVILELPNAHELTEKIGVEFTAITAGEWKNMGSPFEPLSEREKARFQELVNETYERFLRVVAQGRKMTVEKARAVADGQIYSSDEALANGLVDRLGYLEDAIVEATERADLTEPQVVRYNRPLTLADALFGLTAPNRGLVIDEKTLMEWRTPRMMMIMR